MVKCKHCGHSWNYIGKNTYTNCPRCDYKVFGIKNEASTQSENSKLVKYTIEINPNGRRKILIIPVGDIHIGAPEDSCMLNALKGYLNFIHKRSEAYMIGMGDYGDWAQRMQQPGRGPNLRMESLPPNQQYETLYKLFYPLAEEGKILGLLSGNHDMWMFEYGGFDIVKELSRDLNIPYFANPCNLVVKLGKQTYSIYAMHGRSNAKTKSGKLGALERATKDIFADFLLMAHTHAKGAFEGGKYFYGEMRKCYYCLTGSFLNWEGSYAQFWGDISPCGVVRLELYAGKTEYVGREWDYHVSI